MENYRLKIKVGEYEFDAEGPHDVVQAQFQAFQEMIANVPLQPKPPAPTPEARDPQPENGLTKTERANVDASISQIMKVENRVVSLTVPPKSVDDAALLLLFGQRLMRNNESATGSEIVDGLAATGGLDVGRSDRMFERLARNGDVIMIGERRGKKYRLTNAGINKARIIAATLISLVSGE